MLNEKVPVRKVSVFRMFGYALGEGAASITMNGISAFAMIYYTQVLNLSAVYAGVALSVTTLWDAVTDPVMGHITDNTRSRFGRRHPYLFWGGLALAGSYCLLWVMPGNFSSATAVFWCILIANLFVRTAFTVFSVPYTALGFEICPDYIDRSRLQGIRYFINQVTNILFGAMAWSMFFGDRIAEDGSRIDGTLIGSNYQTMGCILSVVAFIMILLSIFSTRGCARDNRTAHVEGNSLNAFYRDLAAIFKDRLAWYVFGFFGVAQMAMLLTGQVQMFAYIHYMHFSSTEKTYVHAAGMLAFAIGSIFLSRLVKRFDKKAAGYIGMLVSSFGGLLLFVLFMGNIITPQQTVLIAGRNFPLAVVLFGLLQSLWWGGCGVLVPLATSMIADISAINQRRTGVIKDGSYAAIFTFIIKAIVSIGLLITGWMVSGAGIVPGVEAQTEAAARNIAAMTFICGPFIMLISFLILRKYPVDCHYMGRVQ
jgi:glycoside/pentoside/hexuronide:cation symporter, GPH family